MTLLNVLSVDVEDYFQAEALHVPYECWGSCGLRVERNVNRILELFAKYEAKGTFFVLGWIAEKLPHLAREISGAGHEIGCHGYAHRRLQTMMPEQFRLDLSRATICLTDQIQKPMQCYRAPSFSVVKDTLWAIDILAEQGYRFDSSVFPVRHDFYGIPGAERFAHWQVTPLGNRIFEFPPSTIRQLHNNLGVGGGGYLRIFPYRMTQWGLRHINHIEREPAMVYFHPWEIDPEQPQIRAGLRSRLRHYTNLSIMESKIERLLKEFHFTTLSDACTQHHAYLETARALSAAASTDRQFPVKCASRQMN